MIEYRTGDALDPNVPGRVAIVHVCNDVGEFGAGFALAVAKRHPVVQRRFLWWAHGDERSGTMRPYRLGAVQWIGVGADLGRHHRFGDRWVVNVVAQHGLRSPSNPVPLDLVVLEECLGVVAREAREMSVVMPLIGCGHGGGRWEHVELVVKRTLVAAGVPVFVFTLPGDPDLPNSGHAPRGSDPEQGGPSPQRSSRPLAG